MKRLFAVTLAGLVAVAAPSLEAQDPGAAPAYGDVQLQGGFVPDPHTVQLTAGGSINVNMGGCTYGHVANAPDVDLRYSGNGSRTLYITVESSEDVTLLINMPNGSWVCDDDGFTGTNPIVVVQNAPSGLYDIWVGTYGSSTVQATLRISEIDPRGGRNQPAQGPRPTASSGATPDPGATPAYGTVQLQGGFVPDPHTVQLTAGGSINVNMGSCTYGHVANAPDVDLRYSGNGSRTLYIYAEANEDITLLINMPDGSWVCDDDGLGGRNPLVIVRNAPSGLYDIWVGSYGSGMVQANLRISEIAPSAK